jgi:hypothetical protein
MMISVRLPRKLVYVRLKFVMLIVMFPISDVFNYELDRGKVILLTGC